MSLRRLAPLVGRGLRNQRGWPGDSQCIALMQPNPFRDFSAQAVADQASSAPQMPPFDHKPEPYTGPSKEEVSARAGRKI